MTTQPGPAVFAVQYVYDDRTDVRDEVRPAHRAYLRSLLDDGVLLASGPYTGSTSEPGAATGAATAEAPRDGAGDPAAADPDGALLLVRAASEAELAEVLARDPFATAGLIARTTARGWVPVMGPWAG